MNKLKLALIVLLGVAGIWLAGCQVREPGTAAANQPPTTLISVAPLQNDTVNHYLPLRWAGNDPDGTVMGFNLYIDDVLVAFTTARDTAIAFEATADGTPTLRTFKVAAVDNEGVQDPDPPVRTFYVINFRPVAVIDPEGSIAPNSTVSRGFRVTVAAADSNPSLNFFSYALDDPNAWSPWFADSVFIFADPAIIADSALFPDHVVGIPNTALTPGAHTLYLRVQDAGGAISDPVAIPFTVADGLRPAMNQTPSALYGTSEFYPDGSVYWSQEFGIVTNIVFSADASAYGGEINAYRFSVNQGPWSPWQAESEVDTTNLPPGEYLFQFMARDIAGTESDTITYFVRLVQQVLSDSIIVVDETRNGTGNPGSPNDIQVDQFYASILDGFKARSLDWDSNRVGDVNYVSPYDVRNAGLIVWHSDDRSAIFWADNTRLLRDFLNKGGRLLLSGWDVMAPLGTIQGDSLTFVAGSFARERLRVFSARRNTSRRALGWDGINGYPSVFIDPAKVPTTWNGQIDYTWTFRQRGEAQVIGLLVVSDSTSNPLHHRPTAYVYDQSFRVAVFGVPLYFTQQPQADVLFEAVIPRLLTGLGPAF